MPQKHQEAEARTLMPEDSLARFRQHREARGEAEDGRGQLLRLSAPLWPCSAQHTAYAPPEWWLPEPTNVWGVKTWASHFTPSS